MQHISRLMISKPAAGMSYLLFVIHSFHSKEQNIKFSENLQWEILAYPFCTILILPQLHKGCATPVPPCRYEFQMLWGMIYYKV